MLITLAEIHMAVLDLTVGQDSEHTVEAERVNIVFITFGGKDGLLKSTEKGQLYVYVFVPGGEGDYPMRYSG